MFLNYSLTMPCDEYSVPAVRRIFSATLAQLGVSLVCIQDLALAVTEACANVVEHSCGAATEFEVRIVITDRACEISVIDTGTGFDHHLHVAPSLEAERGRGLQLMRALVDSVDIDSMANQGTKVRLRKLLNFDSDSLVRHISERVEARRSPVNA